MGSDLGGGGAGGLTLDWVDQLVAFAQTYVHESIQSRPFETDCEKYDPAVPTAAGTLAANGMETFSVVGAGSVTAKINTGQSGIIRVTCDAAAGSSINVTELGGTANNPLLDSGLTRPFFASSYMRLNATPTANSIIMPVSLVGNDDKTIGIRPTISATHLVFGLLTVGLEVSSQPIPDGTQYHHYSIGWDPDRNLLLAFFDLNPQEIGSYSPAGGEMDNVVQQFRWHVSNGGAGGANSIDQDKTLILTNNP